MHLSTLPVLLAVIALACAAPEGYGKKAKPVVKTTTVASDVPLEFDCSDKEDRGYVIGCNQDYFLCWKGAMTKASCPDGMMFNQDNGQCDFNQNIFECSGVRTSTPLAEEYSTLKPIDFDCSKLTDGDYAFSSDCQAMYVSCVGGQGIERTCPDELQFDPKNRLCERIENIEACGGSATTVAPEMEIEFDCPSPDGSFALTSQLCSSVYYLCKDNKASVAVCDEQMIWDDSKKVCALAKDIPDCSFDCSNKADAAYSDGCSQYYWWCWQERAIKQVCPEGMKFDGEHGLCDFESNIFECTGVQTTTLAADEPSTMKPVNFDCTGLEDGNHAFKNGEKCQPKFVSCVGGLAWEMTCPDGLLFDPDQLLCERLEAIVACGGTAEPISTTLKDYSYQSTTPMPVTHRQKLQKTTTLADVPKDNYGGYNSYETTTIADVPMTTQKHLKRKHKTTPLMTTTIAADVPTEDSYGSYETTTLADIPTTTRRSYNHRTTTLVADVPTTKAYGGYNVRKTTTLADIPTTKSYHQRKTTTLADIPTTKAYSHKRRTTTLADEPITTTLGYNGDDYGEKIDLASTTLSDELLTTRRHRMHKTTTVAADIPTEDSYGSYETTTLADIPTTKAYGHKRKLTTTLADIPTTKSYGGYNVRKTTTLADIPTTKAYGGYNVRKTTTLADIPTTTTKSYGGYNVRKTTTLADIPTTKAYGGYNQRKLTTTLADIPTTKAYGHKKHHKMTTTTVAADVPKDDYYGGYETTTLADIPTTTTRRSYNHRTTTLADIPTTKSYGYNVRKTTTLADIPTTKAYGGYHQRKTTTLADIPTTRKSYGGYRTTTPLADIPETTTIRQRSTYAKVKPTVADQPQIKQGY